MKIVEINLRILTLTACVYNAVLFTVR